MSDELKALYSLSYLGRQFCIKYQRDQLDSEIIADFKGQLNAPIKLYTEEPCAPQEDYEGHVCHYCKLQLFGNVYKCNKCSKRNDCHFVHMACCKETNDKEIICLHCILGRTNYEQASKESLIRRFLNAHFRTFDSPYNKLIEYYVNHYNDFYNENGIVLNFFDFLKNMGVNVIRKFNGNCVILFNDEDLRNFQFNPFDFFLTIIQNKSNFIPVYDILLTEGVEIHIVDTDVISKFFPELEQEKINHKVINYIKLY